MIVTQEWTHALPVMQQTVLIAAIRAPDGLPKYSGAKMLLRWYRRCVLVPAMHEGHTVFTSPVEPGGQSFMGPSLVSGWVAEPWEAAVGPIVDSYIRELDAIPHHFQVHLLHGVEIIGYMHPDPRIRVWWKGLYYRLVHNLHLKPESAEDMDRRLSDDEQQWFDGSDKATIK